MRTKRLTSTAMLIAIYVIFSILTPVKLQNFKFTFEALPILAGGILYGPVYGLAVGAIGSFIYQMLFSGYGVTITTPLWIIPHAVSGLIVGLYSKAHRYHLTTVQTIVIAIVSAVTVTVLNTLALFADARIFGYYTKALVFGSIPLKILTGIILAVLFSLVLPPLLKAISKIKD